MTETPLFETDDLEVAPMGRSAILSTDGLYRYELTRVWADPRNTLSWVMLNPSIADAQADDPTIRRCIGFARALGYGGIRVLNLYAFISTDPDAMHLAPDPVGPDNDRYLTEHFQNAARRDAPVIAAWGAKARPDRVAQVLALPDSGRFHALGVTQDGSPKHPLARGLHRIPDNAQPVRWSA